MKRCASLGAWAAMLGGGLWFALQPVRVETGRFFFLHPKWAETLDRLDWAVNFAAFGLFAWLTVRMFGGDSRRWVALPAVLLTAIGIYGVRADKVVAVPLAMDARTFTAAAELPRKMARERLGWPADRRIVFCLRRLTRRMGLDRLVDAWKLVVAAHPEALLVIGGTGPLRNELEEQVHKSGLGSHVLFAGFVAEKDLPMAYRAADFSVVPSVAMEGFGLVILESLAVGTPVLVTPVGGMPEIVKPLEPRLVLQDASVGELERGLNDLLAGRLPVPEEKVCVEYVRRNYNWELAARRVMEVYAAAGA